MSHGLRLVKYGDTIVHNHNKDVHDTHETVKYMSASVGVSVESRESLTIMCDANGTCGNAEISTQSQFGLL